MTLLDIDFLNTEKTIHIDAIGSRNIKRFLSEDINFLKKLGVMDYSLLVMKVNWEEVAFFKKKKVDEVVPYDNNIFEIRPSETEIGIHYHFTIIDYLQTYTALKNAENFFKKMIVREFTESVVTAEEPSIYAHRLEKFLEVIFPQH